MKILIPLNGFGSRFQQHGYMDLKPLIRVQGEALINKVISCIPMQKNELFIFAKKELKNYNFESLIYKNYPNFFIKVIYLDQNTSGPVDTLLTGIRSIEEYIEQDEPFLALDGDTVYEEDIFAKLSNLDKSALVYFKTQETQPLYSYVQINEKNLVTNIEEKKQISNLANTGAYYFHSINLFKNIAQSLLLEYKDKECYTSFVYKKLIEQNYKILGIEVCNFNVLGTPLQLQNFCTNNNNFKPYRFVFDLDNTLVTYPTKAGDYTTVQPIQKNINFLNNLKKQGHYIIIYTARRMKTHNGNVNKVIKDIGEITLFTLAKFNIEYDEIQFGKPYADFYIDDLSINPLKDNLNYSTGFYFTDLTETRPFNEIVIHNDTVTKTGNIEGERFWYKNCPSFILNKFFPKIHNLSNDNICMEKIKGLSLSQLYINNLLTENILQKVLFSLQEIHSFESSVTVNPEGNYYSKVLQRYNLNLDLYKNLKNSKNILNEIEDFFDKYKPTSTSIIHGDPVFSNTFLTVNNNIKFIDVRGKIGDTYSIYGDCLYDYAKIYQSILGYDFILHDKRLDISSIKFFKNIFENHIITTINMPHVLDNIRQITKSLLFSMLPLHNDWHKIQKYYNLIDTI